MGNLGEIAEIVNASELTLEVGSDNYILLSDLSLHIGRTESRDVVTSGDPLYSYGSGDNYFTATLLVCLLYTSPSPRDRTRSRMPSSA